MTHDVPSEDDADRRWCGHCELSVELQESEDGPTCPACGRTL